MATVVVDPLLAFFNFCGFPLLSPLSLTRSPAPSHLLPIRSTAIHPPLFLLSGGSRCHHCLPQHRLMSLATTVEVALHITPSLPVKLVPSPRKLSDATASISQPLYTTLLPIPILMHPTTTENTLPQNVYFPHRVSVSTIPHRKLHCPPRSTHLP
ncbi:hypothetical protein BC834DRAFT_647429 [Gloeopeniophorella convolvens]|nr:hypothetical protein BC834DRAFT_647429 [Gloeopeniophorella convolvens]